MHQPLTMWSYNFSGIGQFLQGINLEEGSAGHCQMPCKYPVGAVRVFFYRKNSLNFLERHLQATPRCPVDAL